MSTTEPTPPERDPAAPAPAPAAEQPAAPAVPPATPAPGAPAPADGPGTAPTALEEAEATEAALRAQLGELVSARVRAQAEAARLADRATLAGADPSLLDLSARYRDQAGRLTGEVEGLRAQLRAHEARTEALRADAQGA